jgi:YegS/Rv2252/BmrU family lipid kinase
MKRLMLIVNPQAGRGGYRQGLGEALRVFCAGGWLPTVYFTEKPGDATALAREKSPDYDLLVCMGGDGTLSETVAGLVGLPGAPELGYLPMGTTNDVASSLGLSRDTAEAAATIVTGRAFPLDVGRFNGAHYFNYIAAFGAFTEVSYQTPQEAKATLGHFAYVLAGLKSLPNLPTTRAVIRYDGGVLEGEYIFGAVTNSTTVGGVIHLDDELVSLGDGLFELMLIRAPKSVLDLQTALGELVGRQFDGTQLTLLHSRNISISFPSPVAWTRDGESGGEHREVTLENLHHAVRIRVSPALFAAE